jgi:hypothetical protein
VAITLLGHQPIDFTYKENDPCESLSSMCLQYEIADNPQFQLKNTGTTAPYITIQGIGNDFEETPIYPVMDDTFYTYTINFSSLGITDGCFELCVYDIGSTGTNLVSNGTFLSDLSGWTVADGLVLLIDSYSNPSTGVATDGEVVLLASGGTAAYTYSTDGITYQASATFTGLSYSTNYTFYVKDVYGVVRSLEFEFRDCSDFADSELFDISDIKLFEIADCELFAFE